MNIVFRNDSSFKIGTGHTRRSLSLAVHLKSLGANCKFVCRNDPGNINDLVRSCNIPLIEFNNNRIEDEINAVRGAFNEENLDWIIIDSYLIDIETETALRPHVSKILVIDDFSDRHHDCDLFLNPSIGTEKLTRSLLPVGCQILLGSKYAMVSEKFIQQSKVPRVQKEKVKNVMVFFTSGDDNGETLKALEGLKDLGFKITVVLNDECKTNRTVSNMCTAKNWTIYNYVENMSDLIGSVDLVVGSGGSSNFERCLLGVPAIVSALSEDQINIAEQLSEIGAVIYLGPSKTVATKDYENAVVSLTSKKLKEMSIAGQQLIDGLGVERVSQCIMSC